MTNWHELEREKLIEELDANAEKGLSNSSIAERQKIHGKNEFEEKPPESILRKILHTLSDVSIIILMIAATLALAMGLFNEDAGTNAFIKAAVIFGIVILNVFLAVSQERSAEKSLKALQSLHSPTTMVIRDGRQEEIAATEVVPGDIILLRTGDLISADARLLESADLYVDESILTGESEPSEKNSELELSGRVVVADQNNMVFSGCLVTAGRAKAIVTSTGMKTEMGKIAEHLNNPQKLKTPLQIRIEKIGRIISAIAIVSAIVMFALGIVRGEGMWDMIFMAISLAVAAVPEMLSLIVTLSLVNGTKEMIEQNALIRKLSAVETLGSTSIICSDKTGTLTQNRMTITRLWQPDEDFFCDNDEFNAEQLEFINKFTLVTNAISQLDDDGKKVILGDPTESAILRLSEAKGSTKDELEAKYPRVKEIPFSSLRKMMTTVHKDPNGGYLVLTKGAFDRVPFTEADERTLKRRLRTHDDFAKDALRVIALGSKHIDELPADDKLEELESELHFEGIIGIIDPPRPEAMAAIKKAKSAGIRTIMITGDHAITAAAIARQIGLMAEGDRVVTGLELSEMSDEELIENIEQFSVYARVSPEDKLRIVEAWQELDEVVAMTGDGVNDAPALNVADVGVAMGKEGTEVARSASDMILTDDNYSTIVEAAHRGRDVFSNIRKTVYFLLVVNFSEVTMMIAAILLTGDIMLTPIMLLLINVVADGIPGLRLAHEKSDKRIMMRSPIGRNESLFAGLYGVISAHVVMFVLLGLTAFYVGAYVAISPNVPPSTVVGQTLAFITVGWCSILNIFNVRSRKSMFLREKMGNPLLVIFAWTMVAVFALLVLIHPVGRIFGLAELGLEHWKLAIGLAVLLPIGSEIGKLIALRKEKKAYKGRFVQHRLKG